MDTREHHKEVEIVLELISIFYVFINNQIRQTFSKILNSTLLAMLVGKY